MRELTGLEFLNSKFRVIMKCKIACSDCHFSIYNNGKGMNCSLFERVNSNAIDDMFLKRLEELKKNPDIIKEEKTRVTDEPITRESILQTAKKCVCGNREEDYGSPEDNFKTIASLWEVYLKTKCVGGGADISINADDVAVLMILVKIARISSGHAKYDNWIDIAGYAACGGEIEGSNK